MSDKRDHEDRWPPKETTPEKPPQTTWVRKMQPDRKPCEKRVWPGRG